MERVAALERAAYPYDIVYFRWNVGGDNGAPDATLSDVVRDWNARYAYPKLIIATGSEMFQEFEKRYGDKLPELSRRFHALLGGRGRLLGPRDARSTAPPPSGSCRPRRCGPCRPGAVSRARSSPTLGATWCFTTNIPGAPTTASMSRTRRWSRPNGRSSRPSRSTATPNRRISWSGLFDPFGRRADRRRGGRLQHVELAADQPGRLVERPERFGRRGEGPHGKPVPSQRFSTGELAFLAQDIPPLAGRRYSLHGGQPAAKGRAKAAGTTFPMRPSRCGSIRSRARS